MKGLIIRTVTGAVFVALILSSIIYDAFYFAGLFFVLTAVSIDEFFNLYRNNITSPQRSVGLIAGLATYSLLALIARDVITPYWVIIFIPILFITFIIEIYRKKDNPFANIAITLFPVLYVAVPFSLLNFLFSPYHFLGEFYPNIVIGFFVITWVNDSMAYLGGITLGKRKLLERISPKKSWEGSIIGGISALIVAYAFSFWFKELDHLAWLGMAAIIVIAGTYGDLAESMLKRSLNIKDSGALLPGHGGMLDRFDSVLLSTPFVFLYINLINGIL